MVQRESAGAPSFRLRLALFTVSLVVTTVVAEVIVRRLDGGAFPRLRLFEVARDGAIVLASNARFRLIGSRGAVCEIVTGVHGVRVPSPGAQPAARGAWLAVGDSQVLGFGVDDVDTFAARATAGGVPMINAGVPGYGVEDALHRAGTLLEPLQPRGVLVIVNQANDWEEVRQPAEHRFRVRGGWLLQARSADGWIARSLASPVSRLHLFYYAMQPFAQSRAESFAASAAPPRWLVAPRDEVASTRALADAVQRFAAAHPDVVVVVGFLPVDCATTRTRALRSPFGPSLRGIEPWSDRTLRDQLRQSLSTVPMIDFLPVLASADDFLDDDYHLSPRGHLAVARELMRHLGKEQEHDPGIQAVSHRAVPELARVQGSGKAGREDGRVLPHRDGERAGHDHRGRGDDAAGSAGEVLPARSR